ncbi:hypothetical protein [Lysinibacillus xylanilyticus]|uniref:hypothetical protein n=1 Tax=Lysinibacillus xylanilyticus TaxID=582475 RepID=UPI000A8C6202|nr:hypothetical protein [Lysinibacillus xylanilyticus]
MEVEHEYIFATVEDIPQIEKLFVLAENIFAINLYDKHGLNETSRTVRLEL